MRHLGLILILATLLAGLAITFAEDTNTTDQPQATDNDRPPQRPMRDRGEGDRPRDRMMGEGRRGEGPPPQDVQQPLTPEQINEAVEVMREISPWWADRLEEARKEDEQRFVNMVTRSYPRIRQFLELKQQDPELYKLRIDEARLDSQSRHLSWQLYQAQQNPDDADKAAQLKQELLGVLTEQFDVNQKARQHEIDTLKRQLGNLERDLAKRGEEREAQIQARFDELLNGAERLDRRRLERGEPGGGPDRVPGPAGPGSPPRDGERGRPDHAPVLPPGPPA